MKMRQGWNGRLEGEGVERARTLSLHCELRVFVEPRELFHRQVAEVASPAALRLAVKQGPLCPAVGDHRLLPQVACERRVPHSFVEGGRRSIGKEHAVLVPHHLLEDRGGPLWLELARLLATIRNALRVVHARWRHAIGERRLTE